LNKAILNIDIQDFINTNIGTDIATLLLKGTHFTKVETKDIVEQIEAKKKSKNKLPTWFSTKNIYYPNKLNIEQTSSELTADYKSKLIQGSSIIDITGGFGVDCYYFSKHFKKVVYCEIDKPLSSLVGYNYKLLGADNIETYNIDGIKYLIASNKIFNWVYIDPLRRHDSKGKVFFLNDCLPNVPAQLGTLFKHTNNIMIKTSPLLDLSVGINELQFVKSIYVIGVNNDVKELLWILEKGFAGEIEVKTVNIIKNRQEHFDFMFEDEKKTGSNYARPLTYLYEPNSAILKAGAFQSITKQFDVFKLEKHSHLYTSEHLVDFPGRRFKIEQIVPYNSKSIKRLGIKAANITTRNFPETVQQIRKKLALKDGGDLYLFFTINYDLNKIVIITHKIFLNVRNLS
tara:strand:+ start:19133 stop:20335 length:1203 start_codon:yes stop_codon:yes gene_type:complete